ncbi:MAG TPA: zinc ribbon domain-containing protein, partial [Anaerolineales bacterium]|nr:zinc ribbon domain-containing protein [Anaerolineales bacterium]
DNLVIDIQQPVDTVSMNVDPPAQVVQRADGPYSRVNPGRLEAGQSFTVAVDYEKTSDTLTAETMTAAENNTVPAANVEAANGSTLEALLPVGLAALGVALLIVGGWWFWSIRQERQPAASRRGRRRSSAGEAPTGETVYCHQCGARSRPGDIFCRTCGAKLRT